MHAKKTKQEFIERNQKRTEIFETKYKDKMHMETVTKKTKMCKHWMSTQSCPRMDECKFAHGEHELQIGICNFTKDTCKFALAGTCKFKHVDDEVDPRTTTPVSEEKVTWSSYLSDSPTPLNTPIISTSEPALLSPIFESVDEETSSYSTSLDVSGLDEELANLKISSLPTSSLNNCISPTHQLIDINQLYAFCYNHAYNQAYQNIILSLTPLPVSPTMTTSCCASPLPPLSIIQNETMNEEQKCIKRHVICEKLYGLISKHYEKDKAAIMVNMIFEGSDNLDTIEELLYDDEKFESKMAEAAKLYADTFEAPKQQQEQQKDEVQNEVQNIMSKECKNITLQIGEKTSKSIFKRVTIKVNMSKEQIFDFIRKVEDEKDQLN